MNQKHDRYLNYLNDRIVDTHPAMLKIEEDWLKSIGAPVKKLPKRVAEAVATRMLISALPLEGNQKLAEDIVSRRIIDEALNNKKKGN